MSDEQQERDLVEAGFNIASLETKTKGIQYTSEVPQAETWQVYYDFWKSQGHNPDEVLTKVLNAQNAQTGRQSPKQKVRDAVTEIRKTDENPLDEEGNFHPKLAEAVQEANEASRGYVIGAPRAGGGGGARHETGLTKKEREAFGTAVASAMVERGGALSDEEQREIAAALGIDAQLQDL